MDGRLAIDTTALPGWAPPAIGLEIATFVERLNAWFAANGQGLAPPEFGAGEVTLRKVPMPASMP